MSPATPPKPTFARRRAFRALLVIGVLVALLAWPAGRHAWLGAVGGLLVHEEAAPSSVSTILVLSGSGPRAWLQAADLAAAAPAAQIVMFKSVDSQLESEFARRGATVPTDADLARAALESLGVEPARIAVRPLAAGGTTLELAAFRQQLTRRPGGGAVIVANWHHSARAARLARREFGDAVPAVVVPASERATAHDWWAHRDSLRVGLIELQKLALDVLTHPFS